MKRNIPLLIFVCVILGLQAQAQNTNITGTVYDDVTKEAIEMASIRVLNAADSAYVTGAATDAKGKFTISAKRGTYIVQVSFMSYLSQYFKVNARNGVAVLGDIYLKEDAVMLSETVIEAKAPEIIVKGDTVEYNADAYKVQETAVLADLIKKIPGAEIDSEGKITINGKDITKILVDGKEFFSNDPKVASENLPAKMIEKLQVLDQKSDMARLTGFDDGEEQTVINLIARPGMKEGIMGSVSGGYGSEDRYEANGFLNVAKNDNRISALGNFNNNNNAAGGGGGGRGRWGGDRGVTETTMGGINIAMEPSEKFKYDGDIQYNGRDNNVENISSTEYLRQDMSETGTSYTNSNNRNFNTRFKFEWTPDSLTNIIFRPDLSYNRTTNMSVGNSERKSSSNPANDFSTNENSSSKGNTLRFNGNLLVNRKLSDKGRSISFEVSGGLSNGDTDGSTYSLRKFSDRDSIQDQIYNQKNDSYNWRARVSYLEPIGWNNFIELAYNIRGSHSETDKATYDKDASGNYTEVAADYTRNTKNDFLNQTASLAFQSRRQKYNYTIGVELMPSRSQTTVVMPNEAENRDQARNFFNFAPRLEFNYLWDRRHNLRIRYNGQTNQATTDQLFDGILSRNGADITMGNPNLKPSFDHRMNLRYQKYIPEKASSIMAFMNFTYTKDAIARTSRVGESNNIINTYQNIDGNMNGRLMVMYNTPLKNKKFSINTRTYSNYTRDNTFIFDKQSQVNNKNTANVYSIGENLGLKFNTDKFQFDISGNITYEKNNNSYSKDRDQAIYNYGGLGSFQWFLPFNFVLASDLNYSSNSGYEAGYEQNSWIWNAEMAKEFSIIFRSGENKTVLPATVKFRIYDILRDRSNISRSAGADRITYNTYNTISSYFMVGLTVRFQSFKGGAKSSDMEGPGRGFGRGPGGGGGRRPM